MSFAQTGDSTFPDSRNPVRMDTGDQSFAGKPSHGTHATHGTHGTEGTHATHVNDGTHATHGTHGTEGTRATHVNDGTHATHGTRGTEGTRATHANDGTHATHGTHGTQGIQGTHDNNNNNNNVSTFTEVMPLTGAPLVHHVHRNDEPLPGAKGGAQTFDYSPENFENSNDFSTGSGQSQPFRSGEHTATGGHANTARAYGGSTTEASGDFRGPTIASTTDRRDLSSGVNPTHGTHDRTGASNFASGNNDKDPFAGDGTNNTGSGLTHDLHNTSNTHNTSSHVSQPVGDLKPHTGNNASVGRTDNYNTVPAAGNHKLNNPSHHTGGVGANTTPYDGAGNEPTNKPSMGDKLIGKTEQIAGKITNNPGLQEQGEIRKAGLKN